jgi:hypothetical protein
VVNTATAIKAADTKVSLVIEYLHRLTEVGEARLLEDQVSDTSGDISSRAFNCARAIG